VASAAERRLDRPLEAQGAGRRRVEHARKPRLVRRPALDRDRALADGGHHALEADRAELDAGPGADPEALQARRGEDRAVGHPWSAIFLSRVSTLPRISTNSAPPKGAAACSRRRGLPVASVLGRRHARSAGRACPWDPRGEGSPPSQPGRGLARQVLRAVDRDVGLAPQEGRLELAGEEALAPLLLERPLRLPVARRHELQELALGAERPFRYAATSSACASASGLLRVARTSFFPILGRPAPSGGAGGQ
jgi:hypothetical protein